jgi:hypothetical protein
MIDIKAIQAEVDAIEAARRQLDSDRQKLLADRTALEYEKTDIEKKRKEADKVISDAKGIEEIKRLQGELTQSITGLESDQRDAGTKRAELIRWENRLVDIESRQKQDAYKLAQLSDDLSREKAEYRAKLKAEFLEALKNQLPQ